MKHRFETIDAESFDSDKRNALFKIKNWDKSKKGSVDKAIVNLLEMINSKSNKYYTASSCSGRIVIYEHDSKLGKKNEYKTYFISHERINKKEEIIKIINSNKDQNLWLKVESFILHIACKDLLAAMKLIEFANKIGFKHSGIIGISLLRSRRKKLKYDDRIKRITVELKGNHFIDSKIFIDKLDEMLDYSNKYLEMNLNDVSKIEDNIKRILY